MDERRVPETAASVPTADERERLRARIRAAIEERGPRPVALRTLQLLAEAATEPLAEEPGYRVVDRNGAPRLRPPEAGEPADEPVFLTLAELVAELQVRHPALFLPPEPSPEPEPVPVKRSARAAAQAAPEPGTPDAAPSEMRAATARFVETQSVLARSLAAESAARGRALATSVAGRLADLRSGLAGRLRSRPTLAGAGAAEPAAGPGVTFAAALRARAGRLREGVSGLGRDRDDGLHRRWLYGGIAAVVLAVAAAALVTIEREPAAPPPKTPAVTARTEPGPDAKSPPAQPAEVEKAPAEPAPGPPANPNEISGQAEVIDTATLRVAGKLVHLFGVEWVRGGQADELTRYLAGRTVACQPVTGSQNVLCQVEGRDLSEVVLFNGGGRASPEATPDLVAAEDHARTERLGVWKR
ncbi:nuclease [Methylobacterium nigriterrae]|uniref:nuclease n=1 Tax=Methylobacterium nigriterrae TaxID=3127512 RepID=UPI003013D4C6